MVFSFIPVSMLSTASTTSTSHMSTGVLIPQVTSIMLKVWMVLSREQEWMMVGLRLSGKTLVISLVWMLIY
jgi:hypothetical protein